MLSRTKYPYHAPGVFVKNIGGGGTLNPLIGDTHELLLISCCNTERYAAIMQNLSNVTIFCSWVVVLTGAVADIVDVELCGGDDDDDDDANVVDANSGTIVVDNFIRVSWFWDAIRSLLYDSMILFIFSNVRALFG